MIGVAQACESEDGGWTEEWTGESHQEFVSDPAVRRDGIRFKTPRR